MHASEVTPEVAARANELYWDSGRSVNQIADDLDLSKGALYGVIEPLATGLGCPMCGDEVVYPNRTAKDRDLLDCPTCDWDGSADETVPPAPPDLSERSDAAPVTAPTADGPHATTVTPPTAERPSRPARVTARARSEGHAAGPRAPEAERGGRPTAPASPIRPLIADERFRTAVGGALVGAAVGLALVLWARRR